MEKKSIISPQKIHFITVVWGETFIHQFLKTSLPTFLAPGNFASSQNLPDDIYYIFTTPEGSALIKASPLFKKLQQHIHTEIKLIEDTATPQDGSRPLFWEAWKQFGRCYASIVPEARKQQAATFLLQADILISAGYFEHCRMLLASGKKVILDSSIHTESTHLISQLDAYRNGTSSISIPPRDLVKLGFEHLHPYTQVAYWESPSYNNRGPGHLLWKVNDEGIIDIAFNRVTRAIIHPENAPEYPAHSGGEMIDYTASCYPNYNSEDYYLILDSDEGFTVGLEMAKTGDPDYKIKAPSTPQPASYIRAAKWMCENLKPYNHFVCRKPIHLHWKDKSNAWSKASEQALGELDRLFTYYQFYQKEPQLKQDFSQVINHLNETEEKVEELSHQNLTLQNSLSLISETLLKPQGSENNYEIHLQLAQTLIQNGNTSLAIKHLLKLIKISPDKAQTHIIEIVKQISLSNPHIAQTILTKCQKIYERSPA